MTDRIDEVVERVLAKGEWTRTGDMWRALVAAGIEACAAQDEAKAKTLRGNVEARRVKTKKPIYSEWHLRDLLTEARGLEASAARHRSLLPPPAAEGGEDG